MFVIIESIWSNVNNVGVCRRVTLDMCYRIFIVATTTVYELS